MAPVTTVKQSRDLYERLQSGALTSAAASAATLAILLFREIKAELSDASDETAAMLAHASIVAIAEG